MAEDTRDIGDPKGSEEQKNDTSHQSEASSKTDTVSLPKDSNVEDPESNLGVPKTCDNSNLHYEGDVCVYTDPSTKYQYIWDSNKNEWTLRSEVKSVVGGDNLEKSKEQQEKSQTEEPNTAEEDKTKDYEFDGESYCYKDKKTGVTYKYDNSSSSWVVKSSQQKKEKNSVESEQKKEENSEESDDDDDSKGDGVIKQDMSSGTYGYEGDTHTYTDASDGTVYIWDREKNAWFPKVDEDFLAHYQMNYGFIDTNADASKGNEMPDDKTIEIEEENAGLKRKATPQEPSWFEMEEQHNTKVYVSNLPLDVTEQEFVDVMQKCGLVMKDVETGKMKVKLYVEPGTNQLKGDGLCSYIKVESVDLALNLLDGSDLRGHKLHVERAKFQLKGNYDPNLKPKKRKKKDKEKLKKMQEKLFDWRPDKLRGERSKHESVVIVKNLFDPTIFDKEVSLILEYQQDLREECIKCGDVKKVIIYDRHPEGVAQIAFREPEAADACVALLNGRWFGQRKITAETWDGKTKYKITETDAETQQRLQKWSKFLESEEKKDSDKPVVQQDNSSVKKTDENTNNVTESNSNKHSVINDSKVNKTVETESTSVVVDEENSSAGSSDETEGHRSEDEDSKE